MLRASLNREGAHTKNDNARPCFFSALPFPSVMIPGLPRGCEGHARGRHDIPVLQRLRRHVSVSTVIYHGGRYRAFRAAIRRRFRARRRMGLAFCRARMCPHVDTQLLLFHINLACTTDNQLPTVLRPWVRCSSWIDGQQSLGNIETSPLARIPLLVGILSTWRTVHVVKVLVANTSTMGECLGLVAFHGIEVHRAERKAEAAVAQGLPAGLDGCVRRGR